MTLPETKHRNGKFRLAAVQKELKEQGLDGWLFYYFHENDPLALRILGLSEIEHFYSRRWFYFIPSEGEPSKLLHRIEPDALSSLPGQEETYVGWKELEDKLALMLQNHSRIAMQYSPRGAVPYVAKVDAGSLEIIRALGKEIFSAGDLIQKFESVWTAKQLASHIDAGNILRKVVFKAFSEMKSRLLAGIELNEYQMQQFILDLFEENQLTTNSPPIVAVNKHSGSPHYQPTPSSFAPIKMGDFVLLDIWAKKKEPADSIYADITWTGYLGEAVPEKYEKIFQIVRGARDAGLQKVTECVRRKETLHGWEVDDVVRSFIKERGYGPFFLHRTGHSIGVEVHGNGANIDNLETRDERKLISKTGFSIEPGVYLTDFGVRSEIDVYMGEDDVIVAGQPIQTEVIPILSKDYSRFEAEA
jgi:Xaa-Pro aminopeptidase